MSYSRVSKNHVAPVLACALSLAGCTNVLDGEDVGATEEELGSGHGHGHGHGRRKSGWVVIANGKRTHLTPPTPDPRFPIGTPPFDPGGPSLLTRGVWAKYGEGGHYYSNP